MKETAMHIEIYSDVVCPWCYVGKRRLERALAAFGGEVRTTWRPFQLNPTMPLDGMDRKTYLEAKFGSLDAFERLEGQVVAAGAEERIPFAFEQIQRTPNTFAAHRLIWHAQRHGKQDAVVEALFRVYFVEGQDIGNPWILARVATEAGLARDRSEAFLTSDEGADEVRAEEAAGHRLGIRGVPYFVMNGASAISGAHSSDTFISAFKRIEADRAEKKAGP
jgi:predicted DsbA family dithiol-disulfide isomerase